MHNNEKSLGNKIFNVGNYTFLGICALIALIPFYLVIISSFTSEKCILMDGYRLWPRELSTRAYEFVLGKNSAVYNGYKISIITTVIGTLCGLIITSMYAYPASRKHVKYRNVISLIAYIPVVFNGGVVPLYMVLVNLKLQDSLLGLIVPMFVAPMNVFLMLNYFRGLPDAVMESAKMDGAGDFRTFLSIVLPMSGPVLATVALFIILQYWNEWFLALLIINDRKLFPLQYLLRQIMARVSYVQSQAKEAVTAGSMPQESVKMATVVVTIGPIVFVYPFIQKYFVKGITIGAIKG
ncbi:MAG: carbohydrate ABC transporter permease [Clostridiaceae bacterium]